MTTTEDVMIHVQELKKAEGQSVQWCRLFKKWTASKSQVICLARKDAKAKIVELLGGKDSVQRS